MNGATAVPFVSTISPPNMAMTMNTGSSQYFLRSSKNAANSRRKEIIGHSELFHEAVGRRARRLSRDPVAFALRLEAKPQRVFSTEPHEPADWRNAAIVYERQREWAHDREQDEAQLGPQPVERSEQTRTAKCDEREHDGRCQPIGPMRTSLVEREGPNKRRKAGKDVAEPAIRRALDDMLPAVKLMGAKVLVVHAVVPRADAPLTRETAHSGCDCNILARFPARQAKFAAEHLGNMPLLPVRRMTTVDAESPRRCPPVSGILDQHSFVGSSRHAGSTAC